VLTLYLENRVKEDNERQPMKTECNQPIEGRIEQSTRSADGQERSALTVGQQVRVISRWQIRGSADRHEEGGIQRNTLDGKYGGGGSVHH
jgi:hypothetical protein